MVALVLLALVLLVALFVIGGAIAGSIDALTRPREVWSVAGFRRSTWVMQAIGVVCLPLALVYSGAYFFRVRPRLLAAAVAIGPGQGVSADFLRTPNGVTGPIRAATYSRVTSSAVVKIRVMWVLRLLPLLPAISFGGASLVTTGSISSRPTFLWAEWVVIGVVGVACTSWFGINLTPSEAVVNSLRRRRIQWSRVESVRQERFLGGRRVVLWTDQNERIPLRAPVVDFTSLGRRRFESDFQLIGEWWSQHAEIESGRS